MSARSPRGSLSGASSAEVADDFSESLKDLQINNRYEISNLTVIAKENTEHAQAISKVLEDHIRTTAPNKKLPALYLLDSIVKNVGTPYTVYLGRNLYNTFMQAYTLVDANTRKSMDGMLKTWKEPVPGSMDPMPVFPQQTVRPIENALIRAKTVAMQKNPQMPTPGQLYAQPDYRNTPTPPNYAANRFVPPPSQTPPQPYYGQQPSQPSQPNPQPSLSQQHSYQYPIPNPQAVNDVQAVKGEVDSLIAQRQARFGANPYDQRLRDELKALLDLQKYLTDRPYVDPASLQQIRDRVSGLTISTAPSRPTPPPSTPQWQPPVSLPPASQQYSGPYPPTLPAQSQPPAALLAPGALEGLQALLANGQKPGTPQMRATAPALQNAGHAELANVQNQAAAIPAFNGADLIASLTRNGLLPNAQPARPTPPVAAPANGPPPPQSTADLLRSLQGILPSTSQTGTPTMPPAQLANISKPRIPMTASSLKQFRPELVTALYDAQPNQCNTCGRRFLATSEGRAKKDRHLDWHFRTNQRIADPSISRGAHRDWFPTEMDWIQLKEFDASTTTAAEAGAAHTSGSAAGKAKQKRPEERFVKAPPGVTRNTCSICFEEMKSSYSEELQDWVFMNATVHDGKIVHATCLAEMQKGVSSSGGAGALGVAFANAGQRQRSATPDSSLGKRKADGSLAGVGSKLRVG